MARHPSWIYLDLAIIRKLASEYCKNIAETENAAWKYLSVKAKSAARSDKDCIIESTGVLYHLADLWTPELVDKGIYTVKFIASVEVCQERSKSRPCQPIAGYELDEAYAITIEDELQGKVPANLVVDVTELNENKFIEIEKYIMKAKKSFEISKNAEVIGKNQITT